MSLKSLETAVGVLSTFSKSNTTRSVTEIVEETGLKKSHVSKILKTFREAGLLEQDPVTMRYAVGMGMFVLGSRFAARQVMAREALPIMRQLVEDTNHSVTLSVIYETSIMHLMAVEGPLYIDGRWRVGALLPIHATAAGKVLLSGMTAPVREDLLARAGLRALTPLTITDPAILSAQLLEISKTGFALTRGESAPGLSAISVPIFAENSKMVSALSTIMPDQLFDMEKIMLVKEQMFTAARSLSLKLGAPTYPFGGMV
ncbi:IclR family transcriptional regulator [Aquamicrobium terrae]|uniref:IclR family acetate operon transcriptional repressor n=1 Tax=Aquamicrobium terrae TaxID=1324945 RepID=A0ABV2N2A8_9HYPH